MTRRFRAESVSAYLIVHNAAEFRIIHVREAAVEEAEELLLDE